VKAAAQDLLQARRAQLCARLQAQRLIIAQQLGVGPGASDAYPRSKTMRLLTRRPEMLIRVLGALTGLVRFR
jgi:hypothetical protein